MPQEQNEAPRKLEGGWVGIEVSYWNLWELRRELREAKERLWHKSRLSLTVSGSRISSFRYDRFPLRKLFHSLTNLTSLLQANRGKSVSAEPQFRGK